jgi:uncharacterized repeat protein (TIGR02543 family)
VKDGYVFGGWYLDEEMTEEYTFNGTPEESFILYAKWDVNQYTVTFDTMGG